MSVSFKPVEINNIEEGEQYFEFDPGSNSIVNQHEQHFENLNNLPVLDHPPAVYRSSTTSGHTESKLDRRMSGGKVLVVTEKKKKLKDGPSSTSTVLITSGLMFSGFMLFVSGIIVLATERNSTTFTLVAFVFIFCGLALLCGSLVSKMKNVRQLLSRKYWRTINIYKGREPSTMWDWN